MWVGSEPAVVAWRMEHRTSSVSSDVHRMRLQRYLAFTVGLCAALLVALHRLTATRSLAASRPQPRTGSVPLRPPAPAPARRTPNAPSPAPTPPPTGPGPPASPLDLSDTGPATRIPLFRSKLHFFANRGVVPQALLHALDDPENLQVTIPMQVRLPPVGTLVPRQRRLQVVAKVVTGG